MTDHNYAGCQDPLCQRCEDYSAGYVAGKSKTLFEVSTQTTDHAAICGCDPCLAVKERLRRRAAPQERLALAMPSAQILERDRGPISDGLQTELALLFGIELADADLP